jgi:hypothetical protein
MSWASEFRCFDDMSGNGAEVSSPRIGRISCRMSTRSVLSVGDDCSLSKAGMLFCPRYLSAEGSDSSMLAVSTC